MICHGCHSCFLRLQTANLPFSVTFPLPFVCSICLPVLFWLAVWLSIRECRITSPWSQKGSWGSSDQPYIYRYTWYIWRAWWYTVVSYVWMYWLIMCWSPNVAFCGHMIRLGYQGIEISQAILYVGRRIRQWWQNSQGKLQGIQNLRQRGHLARFWARVWQRGERLPGREGLFRVHYEGYVPRPIGTQ